MSNAASLGAQRCQRQHIARVRLDAAIDHCLRPVRTGGEHRAPGPQSRCAQSAPEIERRGIASNSRLEKVITGGSPPGALPQILP